MCYNNSCRLTRWCGSMAEQLICNQQVVGSTPITSSKKCLPVNTRWASVYGRIPEWPKGTDCKSAGIAFGGSNPPSPTRKKHFVRSAFFSYIRLTASYMHKCVILPSAVICALRVRNYKANIISLRNEVEQYHFCVAKISR